MTRLANSSINLPIGELYLATSDVREHVTSLVEEYALCDALDSSSVPLAQPFTEELNFVRHLSEHTNSEHGSFQSCHIPVGVTRKNGVWIRPAVKSSDMEDLFYSEKEF